MSKLYTGSIDLSKIDKDKLYTHKDGRKFLNVAIWINDKPDNYGNHMSIQQQTPKDTPKIYLGNCKEFVREQQETSDWSGGKDEVGDATDDLPF